MPTRAPALASPETEAGAGVEAEADAEVPTRAPALASPLAKDCASLVVSVDY